MSSLILRSSASTLFVPLLVISLGVLYRGHNLPGGGFIGGLVAASGFALLTLAYGVDAARKRLGFSPVVLIAAGLSTALISALPALLGGDPLFTGVWLPAFTVPLLGTVHLGTPLLFDVGVYLAVLGFALTVIFELEELE